MSEVQFQENYIVYFEVCLRYSVKGMLLCTLMLVCGTDEGNFIVYNVV